MKKMRKMVSLLLALAMTFAMACTVTASETGTPGGGE